MREIGLAMACMMLSIASAHAELQPKSRNAVLFVESAQEGHEWEAYRLAEDRRAVVFEVQGPGRVLLSLRSFGESEAVRAVSVVLVDDRIILTAEVEPKVDEGARFPDEPERRPTKVRFYLVRIPSGPHQLTVRYSGGGPTLVAARFSEADQWEETGEGGLPLSSPKPRVEEAPPSVGALRDDEALEAEPAEPAEARRRWRGRAPQKEEVLEPRAGPPRATPEATASPAPDPDARAEQRPLLVRAPWLTFEIGAGVQLERLVPAIGPAAVLEVRLPIPSLDARRFSLGATAAITHARTQSEVRSGGAVIGVARVRHTAVAASLDLRWAFLHEAVVDPYLGLGGGAVFGSIDTLADEQRLSAGTRGGFGVLIAGAALGGLGQRPYLEARFCAGALRSELLRDGSTGYLAATLMIGFRFELVREVAVISP